ncbi:carotenoid oxygenase family protein [Salinarimonas soli]|uniref:Dioxygenase n=1 Tax=Salinarimonas soli TaxID=1638099 RepID=A0A5B2VIP8_9HYPH|nr:carotenoid oxygenase family protein [Salinarimonas soli]KAA2238057.1 carotenoid oxygenase family protein [Salinarimonas soli]
MSRPATAVPTTPAVPTLGFESLDREVADMALSVRGTLPAWIEGALLRTAPGQFEIGGRSFNHWFDGFAMLHRFALRDGAVTYSNRFLRSQARERALAEGRIAFREFGTDPCWSLFRRVVATFRNERTDNCGVSINTVAGEVLAFTETPLPMRFDPETLETLGVSELAPGDADMAVAHPHFDAARGRHYTFDVTFGRRSRYRLIAIDAVTGARETLHEIEVDCPAYMHSFGMSERYLVLVEYPLVVNPLSVLLSGKPFMANFRWEPARGTTFHVVDKDTGRAVARIRGDPGFAFHHVNAYEEGDELVVDMIMHPDGTVMEKLQLASLRSGEPVNLTGILTRTRLDLRAQTARHERLSGEPIELQRIHYERAAGQRHRYVWGVGQTSGAIFLDRIVKIDCETGGALAWTEPGCFPGEPVFVPAPGEGAEDAGVLLSIVLDTAARRSFLLVLDAASLSELARAEAPHHIPFGFHGNFLPSRTTRAGLHA